MRQIRKIKARHGSTNVIKDENGDVNPAYAAFLRKKRDLLTVLNIKRHEPHTPKQFTIVPRLQQQYRSYC